MKRALFSNNPFSARRILVAVFSLALLFFIFPGSPLPSFLWKRVSSLEATLLRLGSSLRSGFTIPLTMFRDKNSLEEENRTLKIRVAGLTSEVAMKTTLQHENSALKGILGRNEQAPQILLATVLSGEKQSFYGTILIDVGAVEGVRVGDLVLANQNLALGVIEDVSAEIAKVKPLSRSGEKTEAFIGSNSVRGEIIGRGSGTFEIDLPHDAVVSEGDSVRLVPTEALPVSGLLLGMVGKIVRTDDNGKQKVFIAIPINLREVEQVFVKKTP